MAQKTLLQKLASGPTLNKAWENLNKSNPSSHGLSNETIASFRGGLKKNIRALKDNLLQGKFAFSPVRGAVHEKKQSSGTVKRRPLKIADVRDRVVQRAIADLIERPLEKKYHLKNEASFAYIEERSIRDAFSRVKRLYAEGRPVVLEADIVKFFDHVDQKCVLDEMVFPALPDHSIDHLISSALASEVGNLNDFPEEDRALFPKGGLPQGGALSPLFANLYLHEFDDTMLAAGYGLVRFADDFVVLCRTEDEASSALALAHSILEGDLGLKLHGLNDGTKKTQILRITQSDFKFLGVRFNGRRMWPSPDAVNRILNKIRDVTEFEPDVDSMLSVLQEANLLLKGWRAAYSFTDIAPALRQVECVLRERLAETFRRMGMPVGENLTDRQFRFTGLEHLFRTRVETASHGVTPGEVAAVS